jgi:hypothetical protein
LRISRGRGKTSRAFRCLDSSLVCRRAAKSSMRPRAAFIRRCQLAILACAVGVEDVRAKDNDAKKLWGFQGFFVSGDIACPY